MSEPAATIVSAVVGIVVLAVVYLVPIWMTVRVRKRGYSGWAWATGISTLFGVGLIVGGIALFVARKEAGPETECPQCGSLARPAGTMMVNQETGEEVKTPILGVIALIAGIALNIFAGWMAVSLWLDPLPSNANVNPCSTIGFMVMIGGSMAGWGGKTLAQRGADKVRTIKYKCSACKYQWTQREGEEGIPAPPPGPVALPQAETSPSAQPVEAAEAKASETCWYCGTMNAIEGAHVEAKMYAKDSGPNWETTAVRIPRCARCQTIHSGGDKALRGMSTLLVILSLAACILPMWISYEMTDKTNVILGIGIGIVVMIAGFAGLAAWNVARLKRKGIKGAAAHQQEHPEVLALKERGWECGDPPKS